MLELKTPLDSRLQEVVANLAPQYGQDLKNKACLAFEPDDRLAENEESQGKASDTQGNSGDFIYSLNSGNRLHVSNLKAKRGEDLYLAAQFNFSSDPIIKGSLDLYLSPNYKDYQPKERGWNLIYVGESGPKAQEGARPATAKLAFSGQMSQPAQDVATFTPQIAEALMAAAFHANGISYSPARAKDPHFAHLVESAANWFVLLAIREKDVLDQESSRIVYLCTNSEDYQNKELHKTQVILL